ncbi:MAG: hypothetical protein WC934_06920, partial [Acidithiobacillus sp.]|uniref:hypothetical protein n=1 Tax=Acidithiobacillus sp. TaxID=1872118 RepID=UPI00355D037F
RNGYFEEILGNKTIIERDMQLPAENEILKKKNIQLEQQLNELNQGFLIYNKIFMQLNQIIKQNYNKEKNDASISLMKDFKPIFPTKEEQELLKKIEKKAEVK